MRRHAHALCVHSLICDVLVRVLTVLGPGNMAGGSPYTSRDSREWASKWGRSLHTVQYVDVGVVEWAGLLQSNMVCAVEQVMVAQLLHGRIPPPLTLCSLALCAVAGGKAKPGWCTWAEHRYPAQYRHCPAQYRHCPAQFRHCPAQLRCCPTQVRRCPAHFGRCHAQFRHCCRAS